jgi:hypothetical protein
MALNVPVICGRDQSRRDATFQHDGQISASAKKSTSEIFLQAGLDRANQLESVQQISFLAQASTAPGPLPPGHCARDSLQPKGLWHVGSGTHAMKGILEMKFAVMIAVASAVIFSSSLALAQNANPASTTTSGDSAAAPVTDNPASLSSPRPARPSPGSGINSGALNNGTSGDTIGTGSGTSGGQGSAAATASPAPGGHKE